MFVLFVSTQTIVLAGDIIVDAGVSLELVDQQINTKDDPKQEIAVINKIVKPYASLSYKAKAFEAFFKGTNNQVRRELDTETTKQDFMEYQYSGKYDIVKNVLSFEASGLRSYRSNNFNSFLVDDFLLNGDSLNKVTSDRANLELNVRRGEIYGLTASSSYSRINSGQRINNVVDESVFDNESYSLSLNAISGKNLEGARINLSSSLRNSKRGTGQDFVSQLVSLSTDIDAYGDFGITLNGTYENNEIKTDFDAPNNGLREFYSVGAGLIWQPQSNRKIDILWNRSFTESEVEGADDEEDDFLSYNINWAFSGRTSLQASFNRRFFGNAGNLSFRHQTRNWRSSISYTEIVSSSSQLINSSEVGLFICENGSTNIADCRLSDTLEPDLQTGETLQPLVVQNFGLNDRIILRKSLSAQTAVTRRRTTLSLTGTKAEDEEIENDRIFNTTTINTGLAFSLSQNTKIQYNFRYSTVELDEEGELESATTKVHSLELSRKISKRFSTALSASYLDRNGEVTRGTPSLRGLNGPLTDRRITFRISYSLGVK